MAEMESVERVPSGRNLEGRAKRLRKETWVSRDTCWLWSSVLETKGQRVVT